MNENLSSNKTYIKRRLATKVKEALKYFSVVVISGARQVGKSTMLLNEFTDFSYFTMDDFDTAEIVRNDPLSFLDKNNNIIIDEAQKMPQIFNAIKITVDEKKDRNIIISGSSNILLMKNISESLAGRALYFELLPITYGELKGITNPKYFPKLFKANEYVLPSFQKKKLNIDLYKLLLNGFMPSNILSNDTKKATMWFDGYIKTYLERDLRQLSQIDSLIDFRKLMQVLALRTGNILRQSDVARDIGLSQATVSRYVKLLEISNVIEKVYGFYNNRSKRVIKSPKLYYIDTGLAIFLSGYFDEDALLNSRELGSYFETMIFLHLKGLCNSLTPPAKIYYFRSSSSNKEVDFVVEYGKKLLAIEVKITKKPTIKDVKNLIDFIKIYPETQVGILLYTGNEILQYSDKIIAMPWWMIDF